MPRLRLPFSRRRRTIRPTLTMILVIFTLALLTPLYIIYKPPHTLIRYFQHRWPDVLWHVPTTKPIIALTIDDAPSSHTADILDVLRDNNVHATFFVIGSQVEPEMLKDMVLAGHELGNHAMKDEPSRSLPTSELRSQVDTVQGMLLEAYDAADSTQGVKWFRPGSGFFSTAMRDMAAKGGYRIALGSVYPHDPQIGYASVNAKHVLSMVRPGSIVICHDRRGWTAPMLRIVLPELRARGFQITTLSGLIDGAK